MKSRQIVQTSPPSSLSDSPRTDTKPCATGSALTSLRSLDLPRLARERSVYTFELCLDRLGNLITNYSVVPE